METSPNMDTELNDTISEDAWSAIESGLKESVRQFFNQAASATYHLHSACRFLGTDDAEHAVEAMELVASYAKTLYYEAVLLQIEQALAANADTDDAVCQKLRRANDRRELYHGLPPGVKRIRQSTIDYAIMCWKAITQRISNPPPINHFYFKLYDDGIVFNCDTIVETHLWVKVEVSEDGDVRNYIDGLITGCPEFTDLDSYLDALSAVWTKGQSNDTSED